MRAAAGGRIPVAQIIGNSALGGVAACILNYYSHMDRERYRFDFFTYGPSPFDEKLHGIDPEAKVFYIPSLDKTFYKAVPALKKLLAEGGYPIAHSHMTTLSAFALRAAKKAGVPVRICHAHSTFDRQSDHWIIKSILRPFAAKDATHLMACGSAAAENLYRARAKEAYILPNAIDLEHFAPDAGEKNALGFSGRLLLFAGRFANQKNLFFLLDAFATARKREAMTLALVGGGEQEQALRAHTEKLGIADSVRFVPPCDPAPYYAAADLFCLPSLYEGFPVVGVEAQSAGLPCLFSDKITREADLCGDNAFLPLDAGVWAEEMLRPRKKNGTPCADPARKTLRHMCGSTAAGGVLRRGAGRFARLKALSGVSRGRNVRILLTGACRRGAGGKRESEKKWKNATSQSGRGSGRICCGCSYGET